MADAGAVQPDRARAGTSGVSPEAFASLEAALDALDASPKRALDLGTGTGRAAFLLAQRYPEAEVVGVDLAEDMLAEARQLTPPELAGRVRFERADAERLSYPDGSFDLVSLANMIPFFEELARVTAPGGAVVFSFSAGPETPIYVPPEVLRVDDWANTVSRNLRISPPATGRRCRHGNAEGRRLHATRTSAARRHRPERPFLRAQSASESEEPRSGSNQIASGTAEESAWTAADFESATRLHCGRGEVAQLVEHTAENRGVAGSMSGPRHRRLLQARA